MRQTIFTLLLACSWSLLCFAQTPYDSFAPEAYRPMLELEKPANRQPDTIFCVVVADLENRMLLLMNVQGGEILAAISLSDDVSKWLSVDPLADKYPGVSPYAYCNWNPIRCFDPDGRGVFHSGTALRQAGESVVNNPRYLRNGQTTYCNLGAQAINAQSGDRSLLGRANEMGISLRNPEIATEISQSEALEYANMGAVVFASYVSNGGEPGHIAIVAPTEGLTYSPTRNEYVVSVFNVGLQNGEMPLSKAFGKRSVGMYILNNDLTILKDKMSTIDGGILQELIVIGESTIKIHTPIEGIDVKSPNDNKYL